MLCQYKWSFLQSQFYTVDIDQYINICNWKCEKCGQCEEVFVLRMQKYLPISYWWEISLLTKVGMCNVYYIPLSPPRLAVGSKSITRNKNVLETSRSSLNVSAKKWLKSLSTHILRSPCLFEIPNKLTFFFIDLFVDSSRNLEPHLKKK